MGGFGGLSLELLKKFPITVSSEGLQKMYYNTKRSVACCKLCHHQVIALYKLFGVGVWGGGIWWGSGFGCFVMRPALIHHGSFQQTATKNIDKGNLIFRLLTSLSLRSLKSLNRRRSAADCLNRPLQSSCRLSWLRHVGTLFRHVFVPCGVSVSHCFALRPITGRLAAPPIEGRVHIPAHPTSRPST